MYLKQKSFLIISVSLEETGQGHFVRSKNLYTFLKKKHFANLVIINEKIFKDKSNNLFFKNLSKLINISKIIILDFSNYYFFKSDFFLKLFYLLKKYENKLVIIDSLYKDSILNYHNFSNPIMIYPYIMKKKSLFSLKYFNEKKKYLIGPKFFIAGSKNKKIKIRKKKFKKILISCGGSDRENCTLKIIKFFSKYRDIFDLNCVLGPFFKKKNILIMKTFIKSYKLKKNVKLLFNIGHLSNIFDKFGIIICTSGLTKYEAAAHGIPSIVITPNEHQKNYHLEFLKKRICFSVHSSDLYKKEDAIIRFLNNFILLKNMIKKGQYLIDFKGSQRIEKILISNFK